VRRDRRGTGERAGQPIVTLVDPDDLRVRADVEETWVDRTPWATACAGADARS
jgi:multidrug resistance efflux pump